MRRPPVRRYLQVGIPLAVGALLVLPLWLGRSVSTGSSNPGLSPLAAQPTSGPLPEVSGPTLAGAAFDASSLPGHVIVLNFWNPDCGPCRKEALALAEAWSTLEASGVRFVGVMYVGGDWPDDRDAARSFVAEHGLTYPVIVDEGSVLARATTIPGIPVTIVVDANGVMRYRIIGPARPGEVEALVRRLGG